MMMIDYLYNNCYGGFSFSEEFQDEFVKRFPEKKIMIITYRSENGWRHDPDIVALWKEMGEKSNGEFSNIKSKLVPEKYVDFVTVHDYDGFESVGVAWNRIFRRLCIKLVSAIRNGEDTTSLLEEYDEVYAQQYSVTQ